VHATDFSATAPEQLTAAARKCGLADRITTTVHDVRDPLPAPDTSVDAVFARMLLCVTLSTKEIRATMDEIARLLRPGGLLVHTVRHTGDAHYGKGIDHGDGIYEHGGFAVHFFDEAPLKSFAQGWKMHRVDAFEEGEPPRRLWRITQANRWPRRWFGSHLSARAGRRSSAACCAVRGRGRSAHSPRR
jgi:SAM-dependent methyltransferase